MLNGVIDKDCLFGRKTMNATNFQKGFRVGFAHSKHVAVMNEFKSRFEFFKAVSVLNHALENFNMQFICVAEDERSNAFFFQRENIINAFWKQMK